MPVRTHSIGRHQTHNRWNNQLTPVLAIESGDIVEFDCHDASGGQVKPGMSAAEYAAIDRNWIHTINGPVFVKGAQAGDTLEINVLKLEHSGWGWTSLVPGLGSLPERFKDPFLFHWQLDGNRSGSLPPATVQVSPFLGIMGVAPAEAGEFRTRPPGPFGGNMDVRQLVQGTKLFLPVFNEGALFSTGDGHAAQGDGEVCINAIEAPLRATVQLTVRKGMKIDQPFAEVPSVPPLAPERGAWAFIASAEQPMDAARNVIHHAIDFLMAKFSLSAEHAYVLCSVALDLKISQCVNVPMITVTGLLAKNLFPASD